MWDFPTSSKTKSAAEIRYRVRQDKRTETGGGAIRHAFYFTGPFLDELKWGQGTRLVVGFGRPGSAYEGRALLKPGGDSGHLLHRSSKNSATLHIEISAVSPWISRTAHESDLCPTWRRSATVDGAIEVTLPGWALHPTTMSVREPADRPPAAEARQATAAPQQTAEAGGGDSAGDTATPPAVNSPRREADFSVAAPAGQAHQDPLGSSRGVDTRASKGIEPAAIEADPSWLTIEQRYAKEALDPPSTPIPGQDGPGPSDDADAAADADAYAAAATDPTVLDGAAIEAPAAADDSETCHPAAGQLSEYPEERFGTAREAPDTGMRDAEDGALGSGSLRDVGTQSAAPPPTTHERSDHRGAWDRPSAPADDAGARPLSIPGGSHVTPQAQGKASPDTNEESGDRPSRESAAGRPSIVGEEGRDGIIDGVFVTAAQLATYRALLSIADADGETPRLHELATAAGLPSAGGANSALISLAAKGLIRTSGSHEAKTYTIAATRKCTRIRVYHPDAPAAPAVPPPRPSVPAAPPASAEGGAAKPWREDLIDLKRLLDAGKTNAEIGQALGRSAGSVSVKLCELGWRRTPQPHLAPPEKAPPPKPSSATAGVPTKTCANPTCGKMFAKPPNMSQVARADSHECSPACSAEVKRRARNGAGTTATVDAIVSYLRQSGQASVLRIGEKFFVGGDGPLSASDIVEIANKRRATSGEPRFVLGG